MIKVFTCIICPNGCEIEADSMAGALCQRGKEYVKQELTAPQRTIASSVLVIDGEDPLVSVRLNHPIPKNKIFAVMDILKRMQIKAPVMAGQVIVRNILDLKSNVIATKSVNKSEKSK